MLHPTIVRYTWLVVSLFFFVAAIRVGGGTAVGLYEAIGRLAQGDALGYGEFAILIAGGVACTGCIVACVYCALRVLGGSKYEKGD